MSSRRAAFLAAALAASLTTAGLCRAEGTLTSGRLPPDPAPGEAEAAVPDLGSVLNKPVTGAREEPGTAGTEPPPSLEALQATRSGDEKPDGLEPGRADTVKTAATLYGARGGLAARSFAINEMLRRHEAELDAAYDFRSLVLPVSGGRTLMRPPVVSAVQLAFALADGSAQAARETSCIYRVTRQAELSSAPPNWRTYLVRTWATPRRPADSSLPRTKQEVAYWNKWVAEGWADGERQAVQIYLSDLGRLESTIVGMARYRVLLRAGLVEQPKVVFHDVAVVGGGDSLHVGDRTIQITGQPGLQGSRSRWKPAAGCPQ